jgi:hypothetical protein
MDALKHLKDGERAVIGGVEHVAYAGRLMKVVAGGERTIEEIEARQTEIRGELRDLDAEHAGQALPEERRSRWNDLNTEFDRNEATLDELRARQERVRQLNEDPEHREEGATFHTPRPGAVRGDDIWDLSTVRASVADPREATRELRDRSLRAVDNARFPVLQGGANLGGVTEEGIQDHLRSLLDTDEEMSDEFDVGYLARRMLVTGLADVPARLEQAAHGPAAHERRAARPVDRRRRVGRLRRPVHARPDDHPDVEPVGEPLPRDLAQHPDHR